MRSITEENAFWSARTGVMSLNTTPGCGKSGMSRTRALISSTVLFMSRLPVLRADGRSRLSPARLGLPARLALPLLLRRRLGGPGARAGTAHLAGGAGGHRGRGALHLLDLAVPFGGRDRLGLAGR